MTGAVIITLALVAALITVDTGTGLTRIIGSDGMTSATSWSRFLLLGVLPVVNAGNFFGTADYFPFFRAVADDIRYPAAAPDGPDGPPGGPG